MSELTDNTTPIEEAVPRRLVRVKEGRWVGGVAAGLGRYFDVNPLIYRIAFAALALAGGTGLLLYLAAWLVIPAEDADESVVVEAIRERRDQPWLLLGVGLLAFGALFALSEARFWPGTGNVWLAATLAGAALVWWHVSRRERPTRAPEAPPAAETATRVVPPARPPKRPSLFAPVVGGLLAAAGLFGLLAVLDVYDIDLAVAFAVAVIGVGAAVAFGALTQRRVGGLVIVGVLLLGAFAIAAITPISVSAGIGEKIERPASVAALEPSYELGIGRLDLDLAEVPLQPGRTEVDASVGFGELVVTVPDGVAVQLDAHVGGGDMEVLGEHHDGFDTDRDLFVPGSTPDAPVLDLEVDVGFGHIEVRRG